LLHCSISNAEYLTARRTAPAPIQGLSMASDISNQENAWPAEALVDGSALPAEVGVKPAATLFARQARMAYGLLHAAIEEVAETVECQNVKLAAELEDLQARALRAIHDSALATIDLFEAMGAAETPGEIAGSQIELARRQRDMVNDRLSAFFASARSMASLMADPINRHLRAWSGAVAPADRGPPEEGDSLLVRLDRLTARQKKVLELLAEGLPNKVIAHRLGISETTVKAHVGEILRKLKVYNRARAIVILAQFDMAQIRALSAAESRQ